ncbi:hypothetical protein V2G26_015061 [Clonostachys chloroleuca]
MQHGTLSLPTSFGFSRVRSGLARHVCIPRSDATAHSRKTHALCLLGLTVVLPFLNHLAPVLGPASFAPPCRKEQEWTTRGEKWWVRDPDKREVFHAAYMWMPSIKFYVCM